MQAKEGNPPSVLAYVPCSFAHPFSSKIAHSSYCFVPAKAGLLYFVGTKSSTTTGVTDPFTKKVIK
jgi:hypothetical protein